MGGGGGVQRNVEYCFLKKDIALATHALAQATAPWQQKKCNV